MLTVAELDELPAAQAAPLLRSCCGSRRWVEAMLARRPFHTRETLLSVAGGVWRSLAAADWKEAFVEHPRIGESGRPAVSARSRAWSAGEQAGMSAAPDAVRRELAQANREYEARFGHTYIVCATGKSAAELLALARQRLGNDPAAELSVAAAEQEKILLLRLEKLLVQSNR